MNAKLAAHLLETTTAHVYWLLRNGHLRGEKVHVRGRSGCPYEWRIPLASVLRYNPGRRDRHQELRLAGAMKISQKESGR